jgi:hypothetical protein
MMGGAVEADRVVGEMGEDSTGRASASKNRSGNAIWVSAGVVKSRNRGREGEKRTSTEGRPLGAKATEQMREERGRGGDKGDAPTTRFPT